MTTYLPLGKRPSTLEQNRLNNNGRTLFEGRYLMSGETIEDAIWRVASNIANAGNISQPSKLLKAHQYYNFILSKSFMPNSPTFFGAGTPLGQLSACYVVPIEDSLDGILKTLRDASHITKYGGGVGFSFSNIRSNGEPISTTDGYASGAVGWLRAYNAMFKELQQGGKRRGAFMGILNIDHPDIEEFIECKRVEGEISMFNLSIGITDKFMSAVRNDLDWNLVDPHSKRIVKTVKAVDLFNRIVEGSHRNGEPAMVFLDTINRKNANIHRYVLEATNPCVTGDTLILTENGWIRADSIVGVPIKIVTDQRLGDSSLKQTNGTFVSGVKPIYEVVTKGGLRVKTTLDHKYMTPTGWKPLEDLSVGEMVHIGSAPKVEVEYTLDYNSFSLGYLTGWAIGDGTITDSDVVLYFYEEKKNNADKCQELLQTLSGSTVSIWKPDNRPEWRISSSWLYKKLKELGVYKDSKLSISKEVYSSNTSFHIGLLQALFDTDGTATRPNQNKNNYVSLTSTSTKLLEGIQLLLQGYGVSSKIYTDRTLAKYKAMPDGKGGSKEYFCQATHEIRITKSNLWNFYHLCGFGVKEKTQRLNWIVDNVNLRQEPYTDVIESVTYAGEETVYDITEPVTHSFIGNGFVLHNCGEQPLEPYNSCNLGSINLANFVSDDGILQQQELENAIRLGVQFLNDVLDVNNYVDLVPELKETALATRRIGLGVMGYWSMLVKLGFSYGSEESNRFTEQLANFFFYTAFSESIKIAGRTKPYPLFKGSQWSHLSGIANITPYTKPDNHFMDIGFTPVALDEMQALRRDAQTYGVANSAILTVAPTGTISTIIGETGGIEPEFALVYVRHWLDGMDRRQMTIVNPLFRERVEREIPDEETRNKIYDLVGKSGTCQNIKELSDECKRLFRVSNDLTPIEHLGVQIAWQKHIDSAISKTINCPSETTIEQMAELYHLAHKNGLKGVTFYRTGSRDMVVLETIQTLEDKKQHNVCELCGSETKVAEGCETCMNPECGYSACSVA